MNLATRTIKAIGAVVKKAERSLIILGALLALGPLLVAIRVFVIANSHGIARHAHTYAEIFTVLFTAVEFLVEVVPLAIIETFEIVSTVINTFGGHIHFHPNKPRFIPVVITTEQIETLFNDLPARCEPYNNAWVVIVHALRGWLHDLVCPIVRATWPIPWLWDVSTTLLGWASFNAIPIGAWGPNGNPGNCEGVDSTDWFCAGLGSGFVLVEGLVPVVVALIFLPLVPLAFSVAEFVTTDAVDEPPRAPDPKRSDDTNMLF